MHSVYGKCTSDELYKIIELINPEVIFEELPSSLFDMFYNDNLLNLIPNVPPEVKCVQKYKQSHKIKHVPVDIEENPNLSDSDISYMFDTFNKYDVYRKIENEHYLLTAKEGFDYINSDKCLALFEEQRIAERNIMEFEIHKNILFNIYKLFHEENDNRENSMLQNIYNYSKENQYNQAVFLIGTAHRKSIMQKITEFEGEAEIKINWTFYNGTLMNKKAYH